MIALFLVVFVVGITNVNSDLLDPGVTKEYDIEARREILIRILVKLNETVKAQIASSTGCAEKMNQTVDECNACRQNLCQEVPPLDEQLKQLLMAGVGASGIFAGKVVNDAANWFENSGKFLGARSAEYLRVLGSTSKTIGNSFKNTGSLVLSEMSETFKSLGNTFVKTAKTIEGAVIDPLKDTFLGLSKQFAQVEGVVKTAVSGTEQVFKKVLDSLKKFGSGLGNFFKNLFTGKRELLLRDQRCVQSCPVCDKVDNKKYTMDQIIEKVCGSDAVTKQDQAKKDIQWLQVTSNNTYTGQNITKIDAHTLVVVDMAKFEFAFKTAKYFTDDGKGHDYPGPLSTKYKEAAGKKMGETYFKERWDSRN